MTPNEPGKPRLNGDDKSLVDLVTAVLVDPNVHTDTRMRLDQEITEILQEADADVYHRSSREVHATPPRAHAQHKAHVPHEHHEPHVHKVPDVLSSVLVDPNLHTDARMRIHREISEILRDVSE
jgi:hypothetical protein